jgi:hypothetical protein
MHKYWVFLYEPTIYEIEAETEREAVREAIRRYKKEEETWIEPEFTVSQIT